ncbi:MAG: hypothetical protein ACR2IV_20785 [Bryobacteraceae bacterium]
MTKQWIYARVLRVVVLFAPTAVAFGAGERWSSRDYTQWSAEEVNRLLTASPWAKQVSGSFRSSPRGEEEASVIPPPGASTANMGGTRGVSDGKWDGGVGRNTDDSAPKFPVTVRWDSALPVRHALLRSRFGDHLAEPGDSKVKLNEPEKDYIITVIGLLANHQSRDRERLEKELIGAAKLVRTGRVSIRPEKVTLDASNGAIEVSFPRTDAIRLDDKEVTFELQFGSINVVKKFRLKTMIYEGKLEL